MSDKPPSRKRYEQKNPTVTFRIAREKKEKLDEIVEGLDITKKAWLETIVDKTTQDYDAAWNEGYEAAREEFHMDVPCAVCGQPVTPNEEGQQRIWELLDRLSREGPFTAKPPDKSLEWKMGHPSCVGRD